MDIIDYYEVYNTDTGALASQTTILDDPNVPEEKRLQPDSTDYNMFATEKNVCNNLLKSLLPINSALDFYNIVRYCIYG